MAKSKDSITYWYYNGIEEHQFKLNCQPDGYVRGRKPREWSEEQLNSMIENQKKHFREKYGVDWATQIKEVQDKREATTLDKYGVKCNLNIEEVKRAAHSLDAEEKRIESYKKTMNKRFGVDNYFQTDECKEKIKTTKSNRYGDEYYSNQDKANITRIERFGSLENYYRFISDKAQNTCLNKYGVNVYTKTEEYLDKAKKTNNMRYGVDWYTQTDEWYAKTVSSCFDKYGGIGFASSILKDKYINSCIDKYGENYKDVFGDKSRQTSLLKYGCEYYTQTVEYHKRARKKYTYYHCSFDSSWELAYFIYMKDHQVDIERCSDKFQFKFNDKIYYYFPDFKINNSELVEIKGDHFFTDSGKMCNPYDHSQDDLYEEKHLCGLRNGVKFLKSNDLKYIFDYLNNTYGKDWLSLFK